MKKLVIIAVLALVAVSANAGRQSDDRNDRGGRGRDRVKHTSQGHNVPDGGSTAALLCVALLGIAAVGRKRFA